MTRSVIVVSTLRLYMGNSAGSSRVMNISRALVSRGLNVYLCSSALSFTDCKTQVKEVGPGTYLVGNETKERMGHLLSVARRLFHVFFVLSYLVRVDRLIRGLQGQYVIYVYPSTEASMDLSVILFYVILRRYPVFYDVNELRRAGLQNVVFSHDFPRKIIQRLQWVIGFLKFWIVEWITRYYDGLIVISTSLSEYFKRYNRKQLQVPILCDANGAPPDPPGFVYGEKFRLCFAGMISLKKEGFDVLYKALSRVRQEYPELELHLYGPISRDEKELILVDLPASLNLERNVIYHGVVGQNQVPYELRKHHLLVLPRPLTLQTHYGFSTKLSEYMVSGIPVLVTDVSDNALYIKDGENGFVVEPGNWEAMARKVLDILKGYNELAGYVSKNAFKTAKTCFHYSRYSRAITGFFFNNVRG